MGHYFCWFLYNLTKLNQEESKNLHRQTATSEIEAVLKKLTTNKILGPVGFTGEFYQTFKEEFLSFSNYSEIFKSGFHISFYEASIILIPKPDKDTTKKRENYRPISMMA